MNRFQQWEGREVAHRQRCQIETEKPKRVPAPRKDNAACPLLNGSGPWRLPAGAGGRAVARLRGTGRPSAAHRHHFHADWVQGDQRQLKWLDPEGTADARLS